MNRRITQLALTLVLALPGTALAQERDGQRGPRDGDRQARPERGDRFGDRGGPQGERPGQRGDRERPDKPSKGKQLPDERIDEAIATLKELFGNNPPPWISQLEEAVEKRPEMVAHRLSRFPRMIELMETRKNRPDEFKLHVEQAGLMREIMRANRERAIAVNDGDQAKADASRAKLRERMKRMFEVRLIMKRIEIERQREKLKQAEQELAELEADSDRLIDEKLKEMEKTSHRPGPGHDGHKRREHPRDGEQERKGPRDQPRDAGGEE